MVPFFDMANHSAASPLSFAYGPLPTGRAAAPPTPSAAAHKALLALSQHKAEASSVPSDLFEPAMGRHSPPPRQRALATAFPCLATSPQQALVLVLGGRQGGEAGAELCINYGTKSTLALALLSGFSPPQPNRADFVGLRVSAGGLALCSAGEEGCHVLSHGGLPDGLLGAAAQALGHSMGSVSHPIAYTQSTVGHLFAGIGSVQGATVVQWVVGQLREKSRALVAAREREGVGLQQGDPGAWRVACNLVSVISQATAALLEDAAGELEAELEEAHK